MTEGLLIKVGMADLNIARGRRGDQDDGLGLVRGTNLVRPSAPLRRNGAHHAAFLRYCPRGTTEYSQVRGYGHSRALESLEEQGSGNGALSGQDGRRRSDVRLHGRLGYDADRSPQRGSDEADAGTIRYCRRREKIPAAITGGRSNSTGDRSIQHSQRAVWSKGDLR